MKKTTKQFLLYGLILIASVLLDQLTKSLVIRDLKPIGVRPVLKGIFQLHYVENRGAAFGMMQGQRTFFLLFSTAAILLIFVLLVWERNHISTFLGVSLTMIAGGGIGNQIDRFVNGYVVDFAEVLFVDFAVFNVADCFVTVGSILVLLDLLIFDRAFLFGSPKKKKNKELT